MRRTAKHNRLRQPRRPCAAPASRSARRASSSKAWSEWCNATCSIAALAVNLFKPRTDDDRRLLLKLARRYRYESVAFWSAVRTSLNNDLVDALMAAGITDPTAIKVELHRPRPLEPGKLLGLARKHAARRRLSFLSSR